MKPREVNVPAKTHKARRAKWAIMEEHVDRRVVEGPDIAEAKAE